MNHRTCKGLPTLLILDDKGRSIWSDLQSYESTGKIVGERHQGYDVLG